MYQERCAAAQAQMAQEGLDYMFAGPPTDMFYLMGHEWWITERLTLFVLPVQGEPTMVLPAFEARRVKPLASFFSLETWEETDSPYEALMKVLGADANRSVRIAVSDHQWASFLLALQDNLPHARFVSGSKVMGPLRLIKRPEEIELLRTSSRSSDAAFMEFVAMPMIGMTEQQLGDRLAGLMKKHGQDSVVFAAACSGPNSGSPHHAPGDRIVQEGDAVLFDFGGRYQGYCSDTSRTVVVDYMPEGFEEVYNVVRGAQQAAIDAIKPGAPVGGVDEAARRFIADAGYGQYFTHRVGHGLGLDEHELPSMDGDNRQALEAGMCFTVEPGIYLPDRFGVRIEDTVLVTETGADRLSDCTREMQIVA